MALKEQDMYRSEYLSYQKQLEEREAYIQNLEAEQAT